MQDFSLTGFRLKSKRYVCSELSERINLSWLLEREYHGIKDATLIQLGNVLGTNAYYPNNMVDAWFEEISDILDKHNCNLVMLMGDRDSYETFKSMNYFNIKCVHNTTRIGDSLFLPRGLTSSANILNGYSDIDLNLTRFTVEPEKLIHPGVAYVFSCLNPIQRPNKDGLVHTAVNMIHDLDYYNIRIADNLISQFNKSYQWFYKGEVAAYQTNYMHYYGVERNEFIKV